MTGRGTCFLSKQKTAKINDTVNGAGGGSCSIKGFVFACFYFFFLLIVTGQQKQLLLL